MRDDKYSGDLHAWIEPELEARVVALVLGEASDFEAEELERLMEERPEIRIFKRRIEGVHGLVDEALVAEDDQDWKLPDEKRERLFAEIGLANRSRDLPAIESGRKGRGSERRIRVAGRRVMWSVAACFLITLFFFVLAMPTMRSKRGAADQESWEPGGATAEGEKRYLWPTEDAKPLARGFGRESGEKNSELFADHFGTGANGALPDPEHAKTLELGSPAVTDDRTLATETFTRKKSVRDNLAVLNKTLLGADSNEPPKEDDAPMVSTGPVPVDPSGEPAPVEPTPPARTPMPSIAAKPVTGAFAVPEAAEPAGVAEKGRSTNSERVDQLKGLKELNAKLNVDQDGDGVDLETRLADMEFAYRMQRETEELPPMEAPVAGRLFKTPAKAKPVPKPASRLSRGGPVPTAEPDPAPVPVPVPVPADGGIALHDADAKAHWHYDGPGAYGRPEDPIAIGGGVDRQAFWSSGGQGGGGGGGGRGGASPGFDREDASFIAGGSEVLPGGKAEGRRPGQGQGLEPGQAGGGFAANLSRTDAKDMREVTRDFVTSDDYVVPSFGIEVAANTKASGKSGGAKGEELGNRRLVRRASLEVAGEAAGPANRSESSESMIAPPTTPVPAQEKQVSGIGNGQDETTKWGAGFRNAGVTPLWDDAKPGDNEGKSDASGAAPDKGRYSISGKIDQERDNERLRFSEESQLGWNGTVRGKDSAPRATVSSGQRIELEGLESNIERFEEREEEMGKKAVNITGFATLDERDARVRTRPPSSGPGNDLDEMKRQAPEAVRKGPAAKTAPDAPRDLVKVKAKDKDKEKRGQESGYSGLADKNAKPGTNQPGNQLALPDLADNKEGKPDRWKTDATGGFTGAPGDEADPFFEADKSSPSGTSSRGRELLATLGDSLAQSEAALEELAPDFGARAAAEQKLKYTVIPNVDFDDVTMEDAITFLQQRTHEFDTINLNGAAPDVREFEGFLSYSNGRGTEDGYAGGRDGTYTDLSSVRIRGVKLQNAPLGEVLDAITDQAGVTYEVNESGKFVLLPVLAEGEEVFERTWELPEAVWTKVTNGKTADPVTTFTGLGIDFKAGATVRYAPTTGKMVVKNTAANLDLLEDLIETSTREVEAKTAALEQYEKTASAEPFSTFSLHISDVSFKLAKAALERGEWPAPEQIRVEEFVNSFDYGDPAPTQAEKVACQVEQAAHPFLQQRNLVRISMRTAALGRSAGTPLRLTVLLDNSGSMERADRVESVRNAFNLLAAQLNPQDQVTLVSFARAPRLLADRITGDKAAQLAQLVDATPSEGGTNIEEALQLGITKAKEQHLEGAQNRIILLTDGAANLGNAKPAELAQLVEEMRQQGIAFDACGVGAEGLNDDILESLTRKGDGRYYFLDRPEDADAGFAKQIAGALRPAAKNVKVQVNFNPERVGRYKLHGFEKHRLKKEDFRNDSVDAAEMAAEEAGNALYQVEVLPDGEGEIGTVSVRFRDMATGQMVEKTWTIPYEPAAPRLEEAPASMRLASGAALLGETLKSSIVGDAVDQDRLVKLVNSLPGEFPADERVRHLVEMTAKARELSAQR